MKGARVVNNEICYPEKHEFEIKKIFESRYNLHKDCYNHRVTHSWEALICDILMEAHGKLYNFLDLIRDPDEYKYLDDSILHEIRLSEDPAMTKAKKLVERFDNR